jgi:hypothetical protein
MRTFIFALAAIVPASCVINRAGAADGLLSLIGPLRFGGFRLG